MDTSSTLKSAPASNSVGGNKEVTKPKKTIAELSALVESAPSQLQRRPALGNLLKALEAEGRESEAKVVRATLESEKEVYLTAMRARQVEKGTAPAAPAHDTVVVKTPMKPQKDEGAPTLPYIADQVNRKRYFLSKNPNDPEEMERCAKTLHWAAMTLKEFHPSQSDLAEELFKEAQGLFNKVRDAEAVESLRGNTRQKFRGHKGQRVNEQHRRHDEKVAHQHNGLNRAQRREEMRRQQQQQQEPVGESPFSVIPTPVEEPAPQPAPAEPVAEQIPPAPAETEASPTKKVAKGKKSTNARKGKKKVAVEA